MKKFILTALVLSLFISCQSDDTQAVTNTEPVAVEFQEVSKSSFWSSDPWFTPSANNFIINNEEQWNSFFELYNSNPVENAPDLTESTVIGAVDDYLSSIGEGDDFTITGVVQFNDTIHVTIHSVETGSTGVGLTMTYQPYHIIKIPKTTLPIIFETITP